MRIGIFTHNFPEGKRVRHDAGVFLRDFSEELMKYHKVYIYKPKISEKVGNWSLFSPLSFFKFMKLVLVGGRESVDFARRNKLDYCLAAWAIPSGIFTFMIKKKLGIPYAVWCLGSDINLYARIPILKQVIRWVLRNADKIFANSYFLKGKIQKFSGLKCVFLPAVTSMKS